jgi:hypothetical protein
MYRKDVNERSPLRLLDKTIHGGLGPGHLGVVLARAGVGKTAFLVQLGLDDLLRERNVLHVSLDSTIDRVRAWYDELFTDLCRYTKLADPSAARLLVERHRMIQVYSDGFSAERLRGVTDILREHAGFVPQAILVDGLDWRNIELGEVKILKDLAIDAGAELWATVLTHRHVIGTKEPEDLPPPCERFDALIDVAVYMAPQSDRVDLRLLRDHDSRQLTATTLELEPVTLRLSDTSVAHIAVPAPTLEPSSCTLHTRSGGETESLFVELAARYGLHSTTWSDGSDAELERAETALGYVGRKIGVDHGSSDGRRSRQLLWHQVRGARQVFVVGTLKDNGLVEGEAAWAVELARAWNKPLWVWDAGRDGWNRWVPQASSWQKANEPRITGQHFTGTGDPSLSDAGRDVIKSLFERSFGEP